MAKYELATAYVSILPSFEGLSKNIDEEISSATPNIKNRMQKALSRAGQLGAAAFSKTFGAGGFVRRFGGTIRNGLGKAFSAVGEIGKNAIVQKVTEAAERLSGVIFNGARAGIVNMGNFIKSTIGSASKTAMAGIGAAVGVIGAQTLGGGLNRALDLNAATSKLAAFGYEAAEIDKIMKSVSGTIDGTRFTNPEAMQTATQLLAAGVKPGKEMEGILQNTVKLADMAGTDFGEMGSLISKAFAGGTIYAEDINQLMDKGIGISTYLADSMGVTADEVKKLASEGKVDFNDLMSAIEAVDFDSTILATKDARLAFSNFRATFSKLGEKMWTPITDNAAQFFFNLRNGMNALQNNDAFKTFMQRFNEGTEVIVQKAIKMSEKFEEFMGSDKIEPFLRKLEEFRESIKGIEGPIIGIGLAIGSSLLGQLPIVGGLLGGLNIPAGILLGTIVLLSTKFSEFGNFADAALDGITKFFNGLVKGLNAESIFGNLGEDNPIQKFFANLTGIVENFDFTKLGERLGGDLKGIFSGLYTELPKIGSALIDLFEKIGKGISTFSGATSGEGAVEVISGFIITIINGISGMIPILVALISTISSIVTSELFTTIFKSIVSIASFVVQNEAILTGFIAILVGIFATGKILSIINGVKGASTALGKGLENFSKSMEKGIKAFFSLIKAIGTGITSALPQIAILAIAVVAIAGLLVLIEKLGFFELLKGLFSFVLEEITQLIERLTPVLGSLIEMINGFLLTLLEIIVKAVPVLTEAFVQIAAVIITGIAVIMPIIMELIRTLADDGFKAGGGALVLAGGLIALSSAFLALAGGGAISSLGDAFSNLVGGKGPIEKIIDLSKTLSELSTDILKVPQVFMSVIPMSLQSGLMISNALGMGIMMGLNPVEAQISNRLRSILNNLQSMLNSNPLKVKVEAPSMARVNSRSSGFSNIRNNVSNTTFNVRNIQDGSTLDQIIKGGR